MEHAMEEELVSKQKNNGSVRFRDSLVFKWFGWHVLFTELSTSVEKGLLLLLKLYCIETTVFLN